MKKLALTFAAALALAGCATQKAAEKEPAEASAAASSAAPVAAAVPPGSAKVGDRTTCPVSKESFVVSESSPKAEYQGKTYYFCCPHCPEEFLADPQKYLAN